MPKDEFDFEDPFELNGMALLTHADTTNDMAECFTEEFMRMGYNHKQVLALFRNPQYLGPHMAFEKRGEPFIRDIIADVFARWGKAVTWPENPLTPALSPSEGARENHSPSQREPVAAGCADVSEISPTRSLLSPLHLGGGEGQGERARHSSCGHGCGCNSTVPKEQTISLDETLTDPMGLPIPKLNV
jgi:hypothetical protein